jgi:hypothetical protein
VAPATVVVAQELSQTTSASNRHLGAALGFLRDARDRFPWADLVAEPKPLADVASLLADSPGPSPRYSVAP